MFEIYISETPNPEAKKFSLGFEVISGGRKGTFKTKEESQNAPMISAILDLKGVKQVYLFDNFITVTKGEDVYWDELEPSVKEVIQTMIDSHDPAFELVDAPGARKTSYENMPDDLRRINEVIDQYIRPALQGDGGDIQVLRYDEDKRVFVFYEGACGGCPTAFTGTLGAIEGFLRDEIDPAITVVAV